MRCGQKYGGLGEGAREREREGGRENSVASSRILFSSSSRHA